MAELGSADGQSLDGLISDLWRFYDEHAAQARQHETLRAGVTTILTGFTATMVGIVTRDGFNRADILPGALIIALGLIGIALSVKHYERNRFHTKVLKVTREEIARLRGDPRVSTHALRKQARKEHADETSSMLVRTRLNRLWLALPILIVVSGIVVVVLAAP